MIPEPKLSQLYQEVILDHNKKPRNYKQISDATQYSHGVNPLCGDDFHIYLLVDSSGIVQDIGFQGSGCAISKSSASMMTTFVKGKTLEEAIRLKDHFLSFMTQETIDQGTREAVGRLKMFEGVRDFPVRVKCATLAWHALGDSLADASKA